MGKVDFFSLTSSAWRGVRSGDNADTESELTKIYYSGRN